MPLFGVFGIGILLSIVITVIFIIQFIIAIIYRYKRLD
jgi:hypothetical protein